MTSYQANSPVPVEGYAVAVGTSSTNPFITVFMNRNPTVYDFNYPVSKRWINTTNSAEFILTGFSNTTGQTLAVWFEIGNQYQTGLWTPLLSIGGVTAGITYAFNSGEYTQVGNVVNFWYNISLTSTNLLTGIVGIANLPIVSSSSSGAYTSPLGEFQFITSSGQTTIGLRFENSSTAGQFVISSANGGGNNTFLLDTNIANNSTFVASGLYFSS